MDLDELIVAEDEGAVLELNDPNGEPLFYDGKRVSIRLAPIDSNRWRKALDVVGDRRIKTANPKTGTSAKSMSEQREDQSFMLASVTISWDNIAFDGGLKDCTLANAKKLYLHPRLGWITRQVDEFLGEQRNFSKASPEN